MKKLTALGLVLLFGIGLSSCKKDWTCKCETGGSAFVSSINNASKDDAKTTCSDLEDTYSSSNQNADCKLVGE